MGVLRELFGNLSDGRAVYKYVLRNGNGMTLEISEFGASIVKLFAPDRNGEFGDVVCGFDTLGSYETAPGYHGATVGRWANRIHRGRFTLDGITYQLGINNGKNHLHGGIKDKLSHKIWESEIICGGDEPSLKLTALSPDGEEGFPGNFSAEVVYTLTNDNAVRIDYHGTTDKKTVVNLTNHSYFNLGGYGSGQILDHVVTIDAETYLEADEELIPTGRILNVEGTPFDFRSPKRVGSDINADHKDIKVANGYDHCFNFTDWVKKPETPSCRATLYCPDTGREMTLITDQPCVHIYSGNGMKFAEYPFKGGCPQIPYGAICFETERMPDSMNHEGFTPCTLDVGESYDYTTIYKFSVK